MRKIVAATFLSLDGVMQAPGGPEEDPPGGFAHGGWTVHYWDDVMGEVMGKIFDAPFDLLLGRTTYDIFAAHWPYAGDEDPIAKAFNATTKYVATTSPGLLTWQNSLALRGDVAGEIAKLKQQDGPMLLIQGSSVLIQTLLKHDLIDELSLLIFPLVLGNGRRMFGVGALPTSLRLIESKVSSIGVVMSRYRRQGEIKTGSFAPPEPSAAEIARREKLTREG